MVELQDPLCPSLMSILIYQLPYPRVIKTSSPLLTIKQILEVVLATKCTKESLSFFHVKELDVMGPRHGLVCPPFLQCRYIIREALFMNFVAFILYNKCSGYKKYSKKI